MQIKKTKMPGCYEIFPIIFKDQRGLFVKIFNEKFFAENNLCFEYAEDFYTFSVKGVLRGLHFQIPPSDYIKLVSCVSGEIIDVLVDLRIGSPTYGQFELFNLNSEKGNILYIPSGLAHGFYVVSDNAIVTYKVSNLYIPKDDEGILWNSLKIPWPNKKPIISERDKNFLPFSDFKSPFKFLGEKGI